MGVPEGVDDFGLTSGISIYPGLGRITETSREPLGVSGSPGCKQLSRSSDCKLTHGEVGADSGRVTLIIGCVGMDGTDELGKSLNLEILGSTKLGIENGENVGGRVGEFKAF